MKADNVQIVARVSLENSRYRVAMAPDTIVTCPTPLYTHVCTNGSQAIGNACSVPWAKCAIILNTTKQNQNKSKENKINTDTYTCCLILN